MRTFLYVMCFSLFLAAVYAADKCAEQADCGEGQCCSSYMPMMGGVCRDLTVAGGKCKMDPNVNPVFGDMNIGPCPCAKGLGCVIDPAKKKNNGVCQAPATTAAPAAADDAVAA